MSSSLCISASLSQSTTLLLVAIIICAGVGAESIWNWGEVVGDSRGREREEAAVGDVGHGSRISRKRSSIVASDTASGSCCWVVVV
jgi:hypothetical protein